MRRRPGLISAAAVLTAIGLAAASKAESPRAAPRYTADGKLEFPGDYRSWVYLSTGMDMSYVDVPGPADQHLFDSVFVNRGAYDAFQKTGHWPDKTMMVLEARKGASRGSINKRGQFQSDRVALEVHVRDEARFKDTGGWQFFGFRDETPGTKIAGPACLSCHEAHGAVDTTFVQFYPTLLPVAQAKKTFSVNYLKEVAAEQTK